LNISADESPFTLGAQALDYVDTVTNASNPDLKYDLPTPLTDAICIQFDYKVANNSGNNITLSLQGEDLADDLVLRLRSGGAVRNQLNSGTELIAGISLSTWYHVEITTSVINPSGVETYDISVGEFGGSTVSLTGLSFRNDVDTAYASILLTDGSGAANTSNFTVDNFSITLIPEPSIAGLLGVGCLSLVASRRRRSRP
jgi:hypothetical protein